MGPGATRAELALELAFAVLGAGAMLIYALTAFPQWSIIQTAVAVLLAFDIAGGVVTNATSSAKRWYHRPGQGARQQLQFVALHVIHLVVVAWLFRSGDWWYAIAFSIYLLAAAVAIVRTPLYVQRALALGLTGIAFVMGSIVFTPTPGLEWFIPLLFLKLLVSHLLREEPYLPEQA
jgi:hypothetical protein